MFKEFKSILSILVIVCLCLTMLCACGNNDSVGEITENNFTAENTGTSTTEEKQPDILYTGVWYELPSNGAHKVNALKTDGTYDSLGERGVYGYPQITDDGKYIFYRQTAPNAETREYTERLFVMQPGGNAFELAEYAEHFVLGKGEKCVAAVCEDGIYFTDDFSKRCEKLMDLSDVADSCVISETNTKIACIDKNENLYMIDVVSKTATTVDTGVTYIMKRVCDNALYYTKDSGLYLWSNGTSSFVSEWWTSTSFGQIFATGTDRDRQYHYLTSKGAIFDIPKNIEVSSFSKISPNEKFFVTDSGDTIYRYEITDNGLINQSAFHGKDITIYSVNNDGIIIACSSTEKSFGVFENSEYKKLSDGILLALDSAYFGNKCVYYSYDNVLYRYTFGGAVEQITENIHSFIANGDYCYYINNYDNSKKYGDLWSVGIDTMIDDYVKQVTTKSASFLK